MRTKQLVLTALFAALTAIGAFLKIQIPVEGIPAITLQFFFTASWACRFLRWAADFLTCFNRASAFCWG